MGLSVVGTSHVEIVPLKSLVAVVARTGQQGVVDATKWFGYVTKIVGGLWLQVDIK